MTTRTAQAVLFDLDGTLLDTHDLLLATFRYTARTVLREAISDERLMAKVGQPLNTQMWDFTDDPAVHEELCRVYREYNAEVHDDMIRLFDGTVPMLERLKEAGLPLAVVTSKRHEVAMRGLDLFGLTGYFDFLIGSHGRPGPGWHPCPGARRTAGSKSRIPAPWRTAANGWGWLLRRACTWATVPSTCSREAARAAPPRRRYGVCSLRSRLKRSVLLTCAPTARMFRRC